MGNWDIRLAAPRDTGKRVTGLAFFLVLVVFNSHGLEGDNLESVLKSRALGAPGDGKWEMGLHIYFLFRLSNLRYSARGRRKNQLHLLNDQSTMMREGSCNCHSHHRLMAWNRSQLHMPRSDPRCSFHSELYLQHTHKYPF